jgi:hypothetical protein
VENNEMSPEYLALANKRATFLCEPDKQPEDYGYDFKEWVSPYTKCAHRVGGVAIVLQDWASEGGLVRFDPIVQLHGRAPTLLTNQRLDALLRSVLGLEIYDVYVTNTFPFVKAGTMSAALSKRRTLDAAKIFLAHELALARPAMTLALSAVAYDTLTDCGVKSIRLPHPAARIGSLRKHEAEWRETIAAAGKQSNGWLTT